MIIDGVFAHPIDTKIWRSTLECHETSVGCRTTFRSVDK